MLFFFPSISCHATGALRVNHAFDEKGHSTFGKGDRQKVWQKIIQLSGLWTEYYINTLYAGRLTRGCNAD